MQTANKSESMLSHFSLHISDVALLLTPLIMRPCNNVGEQVLLRNWKGKSWETGMRRDKENVMMKMNGYLPGCLKKIRIKLSHIHF